VLHGLLGACGLILVINAFSDSSTTNGFGRLAVILLAGALSLGLLFQPASVSSGPKRLNEHGEAA
jgi:hypothetical protein